MLWAIPLRANASGISSAFQGSCSPTLQLSVAVTLKIFLKMLSFLKFLEKMNFKNGHHLFKHRQARLRQLSSTVSIKTSKTVHLFYFLYAVMSLLLLLDRILKIVKVWLPPPLLAASKEPAKSSWLDSVSFSILIPSDLRKAKCQWLDCFQDGSIKQPTQVRRWSVLWENGCQVASLCRLPGR